MFTGDEILEDLNELNISHVVWVPDSTLGQWEAALRSSDTIKLITVCREGEAWAVAAGLYLGGEIPLVVIQCTGLFESGDSMRDILHDYQIPLFAIIGYRSYLNESTLPGDTARIYTEPILKAWNIDYRLIDEPRKRDLIKQHYQTCQTERRPGAVLISEGRA